MLPFPTVATNTGTPPALLAHLLLRNPRFCPHHAPIYEHRCAVTYPECPNDHEDGSLACAEHAGMERRWKFFNNAGTYRRKQRMRAAGVQFEVCRTLAAPQPKSTHPRNKTVGDGGRYTYDRVVVDPFCTITTANLYGMPKLTRSRPALCRHGQAL